MRQKQLTQEQRDQIADLYQRGEKVLVIAELYGVTSSYVSKLAGRRKLPPRRPSSQGRRMTFLEQGEHYELTGLPVA